MALVQNDTSRRRSTRLSGAFNSRTTSEPPLVPSQSPASSGVVSITPKSRKRAHKDLQSSVSTKKNRVSQTTSSTHVKKAELPSTFSSPHLSGSTSKKGLRSTPRGKGKGKAKGKKLDATEDEDDELFASQRDAEPRSSSPEVVRKASQAAGKRRRVDTESEEEFKGSNGELDEDSASEIEAEMIRTVIEKSKQEVFIGPSSRRKSHKDPGASSATTLPASSSRPQRSASKPVAIDVSECEGEDEDWVKDVQSDLKSSDLSSPEELDSDASVGQPPVVRKATSRRSRQRTQRTSNKPDVKLTWWQRNQIKLERHHPELRDVWGDLTKKVQVIQPTRAVQPAGLSLTLLPFQLEGLHWMKKQEAGPWAGGMLADEMGMGKTIQTIALILSDSAPGDGKQTLVIAPTVAIIQWRNEIEKFTQGFSVNVWHGQNRSVDHKQMKSYDIVLTSYAVLESTFRRQNSGFMKKGQLLKEKSTLHEMQWHRIILDEAHNIKDRGCNTARGAFQLQAKYKWCLSGTPLQNRVGELYSLIRFLGADPFSYYFCKSCDCKTLHWMFSDRRSCDECHHSPMQHVCFWNNEILKPVQKYGASIEGSHGHTAFKKLQVLLDRMMLRRTKLERADDLGLPPRAVQVRRDYFTEEEEELYTSLYSDVQRKFSTFADAGTVLNNYGNIFQLITRMRQMSNHPDLVLKSRAAQAAFKIGQKAGQEEDVGSIHTCRICLDEAEDAIISKCRHIFCRECARQYLETATEREPECPVCHLPISIDLSQDAINDEASATARQGVLARLDPGKWRTSTKIEALVEELSKLNHEDHSIKSLVFSQFTVFLDLIERRLQLAGFKLARLQGHMTPEARDRTIKYFMNNNDVQVFLVSLKAGGVALNLTEASRVFIMDPWWNPAVELQAMDRIHRLGQHRPVVVTRLIIENSIESRIVELQKKKEAMTGAALGDDDQALGRLTPEDLSFLFTL